jgi:hypothetical protein
LYFFNAGRFRDHPGLWDAVRRAEPQLLRHLPPPAA